MPRYGVYLHQPGVYTGTGESKRALVYTLYEVGSGDSDFLSDPTLKLEVNKAGSLEFDILPSHSYYSLLRRYIQYVSVKNIETGEIIFYGRILSMSLSFNGIKHIVCEGLLANLLDCPVFNVAGIDVVQTHTPERLFAISGTPAQMFRMAIQAYQTIRQDISIGYIHSDADTYDLGEIDVSGGQSVGDFITSNLVEVHGGFLQMLYEVGQYGDISGELYWEADPTMDGYNRDIVNQPIAFGTNLLDLSAENQDDEIMAGIVPVWTDENDEKKWISVPLGNDEYMPRIFGTSSGIGAVGIQIVDIPEVKSQTDAEGFANTYVSRYCDYDLSNIEFDSFTVRALDLSYLGNSQYNEIKLYDRVTLTCLPLSINKILTCTSVELVIDNPGNTSYTLSVYRPKASSNDKVLTRQLKLGKAKTRRF